MNISQKGINLIASFEGLSLKACKCLPTEKYYTIGYGHYGADVKKDMVITKEKSLELLRKDVKNAVSKVSKYQKKYKFKQNEFDALVSFCYNVGNIRQLTDNGRRSKSEIASKMVVYNKSGGKVVRGLTNRRKKEQSVFLKGSY